VLNSETSSKARPNWVGPGQSDKNVAAKPVRIEYTFETILNYILLRLTKLKPPQSILLRMWDGALLILPEIHAHVVQISLANPLAFFR